MDNQVNFFIMVNFPYVIFSTLAALILWQDDIKSIWPRLLLYSVISAAFQTLIGPMDQEALRFSLELAAGLLIALLVFQKEIRWVAKIFITSYLFGFFIVSLFFLIFGSITDEPIFGIYRGKWLWLLALMNAMLVPLASLIGKLGRPVIKSLEMYGEKIAGGYKIILASVAQVFIYVILFSFILKKTEYMGTGILIALYSSTIVILILSLYVPIKYVQAANRKTIIATQAAVSENIMELLNSVRGQRHDFANHLQVIDCLYRRDEKAALGDYLGKLINETGNYGEILKIDNPVISAILNAKISNAYSRGIKVEVNIEASFADFDYRALDLARILGNLIDNAIEASEAEESPRAIYIEILDKGPIIAVSIKNHWSGSENEMQEFLEPGFTSKSSGHEGLGLHICRQLCDKLHARLENYIDRNKQMIAFDVFVPK